MYTQKHQQKRVVIRKRDINQKESIKSPTPGELNRARLPYITVFFAMSFFTYTFVIN